jgi:hypothetical protein
MRHQNVLLKWCIQIHYNINKFSFFFLFLPNSISNPYFSPEKRGGRIEESPVLIATFGISTAHPEKRMVVSEDFHPLR